jgi:FixJ family two-component response regulator
MMIPKATVYVVDDDPSMREALSSLMRSAGMQVVTFSSAQEFLAISLADSPACLVLDVRMPGMNGLDLQRELGASNRQLPIIFITGHGDIPMSVKAMKAGASEFLPKPFLEEDLLEAIRSSLEQDASLLARRAEVGELQARYERLTTREREVMEQVVRGMLNKQVAAALGISEVTVKVHRRHVMEKMGAKSLAEIVQMAGKLGLESNELSS